MADPLLYWETLLPIDNTANLILSCEHDLPRTAFGIKKRN